MITDPALQAQEARDVFVSKSTVKDVEIWQSEIEKLQQDVIKIQKEILATTEKINLERSKLALLKSEYSLESVVASATKEIALSKAVENLEERLEVLRDRIPNLEKQIRQRERDVFDVVNNLEITEISEHFIKWIDSEYLPLQEKYLKLRQELVQRLHQPHHLKVGDRDVLKGIGNCQYLVKTGERKFQLRNTASDEKY